MSVPLLHRLRAMDAAELRFRAATAVRSRVHRARTALAPETWRRDQLRLSADAPDAARRALAAGDWRTAHLQLAAHVTSRPPRFPLVPARTPDIAALVGERYGAAAARAQAERILEGRYDLLGYRDIEAGRTPDWHRDPVHGRGAPLLFWDTIRYLDPAYGDHKITWELNRHQHFLLLGRAYALTGDRRCYERFVDHLTDWIRQNPPLMGTNWASMLELAFRCLSWCWALHFFAPAAGSDDREPWTIDLLLALDRQLAHVEQNLSRYFSPNTHLTGEALALYVCGMSLPELTAAPGYAEVGRDVLVGEADRQVLPDGGHAELSAHYHRYSTEFYLLALAVARTAGDRDAEPALATAARQQAVFLRAIADDSGRLPLTGDDDGGQLFPICRRPPADARDALASAAVLLGDPTLLIGAPPEETAWLCGSTHHIPPTDLPVHEVASTALPDSGYYVLRGPAGHLLFDAGRHGFLNGGHAHADALAITLTVGDEPLLIDPGTGTYTMDPAVRDLFRSTAMHNTVVVNGRSQSEPSGPFHWLRRTDAQCVAWRPGGSADYVEGRHHGYAPTVHTRAVLSLRPLGCWIIVDHLAATGPVTADAMWHLHPAWTPTPLTPHAVRLTRESGSQATLACSAPLHPAEDPRLHAFAPEYGRIEPAPCLASRAEAEVPMAICTMVGTDSGQIQISELAIVVPAGGATSHAFRIDTDPYSLVLLAAFESEGAAAQEPVSWGTAEFRTDARVAVFRLSPSGPVEICVVPFDVASTVHRSRP